MMLIMTKIYESTADLDHDNLTKEVDERRNSQKLLFGNGISASALGTALLELGRWRKFQGTHFEVNAGGGRLTQVLGWTGITVGVASIVASLFSRSKANEAETRLNKLGPQDIVLPDNNNQRGDTALIKTHGQHLQRLEMHRGKIDSSISRVN